MHFLSQEFFFARVVPVMMLLTSVSEKQRTNISTDRSGMSEMRHRNLRSDWCQTCSEVWWSASEQF